MLNATDGVREINYLGGWKDYYIVFLPEMNMASIHDRLAPAVAADTKDGTWAAFVSEIV
jgi:hypothetical protein